jgi:hypothetical protein
VSTRKTASEQEFDGLPICRPSDLLKFNEFGSGGSHPFGLWPDASTACRRVQVIEHRPS